MAGASEGEVLTVFRSRLRSDAGGDYEAMAGELEALARAAPGFVDFKTFAAADGERVSLVTFADRASHEAWRAHPRHRQAQAAGRDRFYAEYVVSVCEVRAVRRFRAGP